MNGATHHNHVAVLAFPFGTHAAPLINLTRMLALAAPNVTFSFFNTAKSNRSISLPDLVNINVYDIEDGVPEGYVFTGRRQEDIELFIEATPENFKKGIEKAVEDTGMDISCVLGDGFIWHAADIAEEMNVPWIPFWTAGACSFLAHCYTDLIRDSVDTVDHTEREELPLNFVPGMASAVRVADLPMEVVGGNLDSIFARLLHKMGQVIIRGNAIVLNSFEELDPSIILHFNSKFCQFLAVGPFQLLSPSSLPVHDPHGCIDWLNGQKAASVAYIGFGTVITPPTHELIALAEALAKSGVPFVWSLKDTVKEQLPKELLSKLVGKGMVVSWVPQSQVLGHAAVGVFVTHCGWNSVLESITGGVPMLCRPFFGDQQLNSRLVSHVWKIGLEVKGGDLSKYGLIDAFDSILSKEEGNKMREKVGELKEMAMQAVRPEGSSTVNFKTLLKIVTTPNL